MKKLSEITDNSLTRDFYTPLNEAIAVINERRQNTELIKSVSEYLNHDIPPHFDQKAPVLYLSRHIATPNYEALHFIELGLQYNLPLIIGQDKKGKFVSHNELKRSLGKLPVTKGMSRRQDEIVENFTIIDFSHVQGKPFADIKTRHGIEIVTFHNNLFNYIYPNKVEIAEESEWIDRNCRGDLLEHYKHMLALLCVHGIMFESYPDYEKDFVNTILRPAMEDVEQKIGCKPLIVELVPSEMEMTKNWNGYPSILYQFIKNDIEGTICE
jgi:hypothetical protein